jgi:hypothetical protein
MHKKPISRKNRKYQRYLKKNPKITVCTHLVPDPHSDFFDLVTSVKLKNGSFRFIKSQRTCATELLGMRWKIN